MDTQPETPTIFERCFSPLGLFVFCVLIVVGGLTLSANDPDRKPVAPKVLTPEEQLRKDAEFLQRRIERQEKEKREGIRR